MSRYQLIRCPYCGAQYLPGEIFLPKHFLGQPKGIEKDYTGAVLYSEGIDQDLTEFYTCDKCLSNFKIVAKINYIVTPEFEAKDIYVQQL